MNWRRMPLRDRANRGGDMEKTDANTLQDALAFATAQLASRDWTDAAQEVLETIGKAANVHRAYLFENHRDDEGDLLTSCRYE